MSNLRRFVDLSSHYFYADDKKYIAEYIYEGNISGRQFAKDHKLSKSRVGIWQKHFKILKESGIDKFHDDRGGRPSKLDDTGSANLCRFINEKQTSQNAATLEEVNNEILEEIKNTLERRGIGNGDAGTKTVTTRTMYNIRQSHECEEGKCQFKTHARIINEADVRNVYSMICMLWAFCAISSPCVVFNWDATQFYVSMEGSETAVYIKSNDDRESLPLTRESSGTLGISIKYYHLHNANGENASAVYLVADDSMSPDDFFVASVIGLGSDTSVGSKGFLAFTKTRNGNEKFYRWFGIEIVVPFVHLVRSIHQPKVNYFS